MRRVASGRTATRARRRWYGRVVGQLKTDQRWLKWLLVDGFALMLALRLADYLTR